MAEALFYLGPGDNSTASGDVLNLNELATGSGNYGVVGFDPGRPFDGRNQSGNRTLVLQLDVTGSDADDLWTNLQAIETKLEQARLARANVQGGHSGVTLAVRLGGATNFVWFDVVDGSLTVPQGATQGPGIDLTTKWLRWGGQGSGVILQLECLPYARGASQALSGSPFTINKAGNFTFYEASIPGDVPALVTYTITDNSSGVVLNKLLISHKSQPDLDSGDWDGVVDVTPSGGGSSGSTGTDYVGSDYATDTVSATQPWTEIGNAQPATPYADQSGIYDVWARVYDALNVPQPPRNVEITSRNTSGSLPAGAYSIVVTNVTSDGESTVSNQVTVRVGGGIDEFTVDWDAPVVGTPVTYRIYWKRDTQDWKYISRSVAFGTAYTLSSESGATTADPPDEPVVLPVAWRGTLGLSSGTQKISGRPVSSKLSNDVYEPVKLFSGVSVPPVALEEGGTVEQSRIGVEAYKDDLLVTAAEGRVDAVWLLPSENVVEAEYLPLDLATARKWVIGRTRHGNPHGVLRNKSTDAEVGQISVSNPPVLGPGDTQVVFLPLVAGGVWNVSGISLSVAVSITPRYAFLRGT